MIWSQELLLRLATGAFVAASLVVLALVVWLRSSRRAGADSATHGRTQSTWRANVGLFAPIALFAFAVIPLLGLNIVQATKPAADVTILMTGRMWYWTYSYPDQGNFSFRAPMLQDAAVDRGSASTRDHIVVPVGKTIRIVAIATNVIYSWAIPAIGASIQALPGGNNESSFKPSEEGRYFGTCLELCGLPHAFKPIEVEVVSAERFAQWVADVKRMSMQRAPLAPQPGK